MISRSMEGNNSVSSYIEFVTSLSLEVALATKNTTYIPWKINELATVGRITINFLDYGR